jgi:hypothetical protein
VNLYPGPKPENCVVRLRISDPATVDYNQLGLNLTYDLPSIIQSSGELHLWVLPLWHSGRPLASSFKGQRFKATFYLDSEIQILLD